MRLILVRHGETPANKTGIIIGYSNEELNDTGLAQAKLLGDRLSLEKIDIAYVSDLVRTKQTATEILSHHPNTKLIESDILREKHAGKMQGQPKTKNREHKHLFETYKPEGGESFLEAQQRITKFYNEIVEKHYGKTVLVVSHGGILGTLFVHLMGLDLIWENYDQFRPKNCSLSIIELDDYKVHNLKLHDCVKHLK
jgi:broad specificity phosphatase PhoE